MIINDPFPNHDHIEGLLVTVGTALAPAPTVTSVMKIVLETSH